MPTFSILLISIATATNLHGIARVLFGLVDTLLTNVVESLIPHQLEGVTPSPLT